MNTLGSGHSHEADKDTSKDGTCQNDVFHNLKKQQKQRQKKGFLLHFPFSRFLFLLLHSGSLQFRLCSGDHAVQPGKLHRSSHDHIDPNHHKNLKTIQICQRQVWLCNVGDYLEGRHRMALRVGPLLAVKQQRESLLQKHSVIFT